MEQQGKEFDSLVELLEAAERHGVSKGETHTYMKRFIEQKARERGVPLRGTFELTPLCNFDCKMCYVHLSGSQLANHSASLLTGQEWRNIIQQAIAMGMIEVTLTGGEALLHPDFDEILEFLDKENITVNLKTNGYLLSEERMSFLIAHHVSCIQITLYGCDDDSYERVTGKRCFADIMAAIARVKASPIDLEVIVTPNKYIWNSMIPLLKLVSSLDVRYSVNPGLLVPLHETGRSEENHDLTLEQYIELRKMHLALKGVEISPVCQADIPRVGGCSSMPIQGLRCAAGRSVFSVSWQGMVHACRMLEDIKFDGRSTSFATGWQQINEAANQYPSPQECEGCAYQGVCTACVIQHSYGAELGHANPELCERAKKMLAEGFYVKK